MLRAATWAAVSSEEQAKSDKISIPDQQRATKAKATELGGEVVAELIVEESRELLDFTSACASIEAYAQLKQLVDRRVVDVLIFLNRGRLGRTAAIVESLALYCLRSGVALFDLSAPPSSLVAREQLHSSGDQLNGVIQSWRYQNELTELRRRHRVGMMNRAKLGKFPSSIPFGWVKKFDESGNPYIVIDEAAAEIIRDLYDLYLSGKGQKLVADGLNAKGYRTPQGLEWGIDHVFAMLRQVRIHAGYVELNRASKDREYVIAKGQQPPIISEEIMQRVIAERARRASEHRTVNTPYLFSGLVDCDRCNWRMHVDRYYGKQRHPALCCAKCHRSIAFPKVKAAFLAWFDQIAQGQAVEVTDTATADKMRGTVARLQKQIETTEKAISRAHTAYVDGVMGEETYRSQVRRKETERAQLAAQIDEALLTLRSTESHRQRVEHIADIAEIGKGMLEHQDTPTVNAWLREFFTVKFGEDREIKITLK